MLKRNWKFDAERGVGVRRNGALEGRSPGFEDGNSFIDSTGDAPAWGPAGESDDACNDALLAGGATSNTGSSTTRSNTSTSGTTGGTLSGGTIQSGLIINVTYDASCANAPAGFETGVAAVVSYFEGHFTNPITLNIAVGYGEVDGQALGSALGESQYYVDSFSYSQVMNALKADGATGSAILPASDPTNGGTYWLSQADAKALGLLSTTGTDGYVGFSSSYTFSYNDSNGVPAGQYDFFGTVAHEISEVMGRETMNGQSFAGTTAYAPLDLFHYSSAGVRDFSGSQAGYFSVNGGTTNLHSFNTNPGGDYGDWASTGPDAFNAFSGSGVVNPVSAADLTEMNVIGWNPVSVGPQISSVAATAGDYNAGKTLTLTLDMSEAVNVSGNPTLTLNDGGTGTYAGGAGTNVLTFSYTVGAGQNTSALAVTAVSGTITDTSGNPLLTTNLPETFAGVIIDTTTPTVVQATASPGSGVEYLGNVVAFKLAFSEAVTVSGTPTLSLSDGGTATYAGGTGTSSLTFSYTVAATDAAVSALAIRAVNLPNGASIQDGAGNAANLSGALTSFSSLQVDPVAAGANVSAIAESPASGDLDTGKTVTLRLSLSGAVTVAGGIPMLSLNDAGAASFTGGSGTSALTFSYMVAAGQNTASLAATAVNLNGATVTSSGGSPVNLSLVGLAQSGPQIDTSPPTLSSASAAAGEYDAGEVLALTLDFSEAVTVSGSPTLALNDGGTATYVSGARTAALTFDYTVTAGQNTSALALTGINGTIDDLAGNPLGAASLPFAGVVIDTTAPTIRSVAEKLAPTGKAIIVTLDMGEAVTVAGGPPTLSLSNGGTATYASGSGTSALAFKYKIQPRQSTSGVTVTAVNLNGSTLDDTAGNAANLSLSGVTQSSLSVAGNLESPVEQTLAQLGSYIASTFPPPGFGGGTPLNDLSVGPSQALPLAAGRL
jgi:hypothetical protein